MQLQVALVVASLGAARAAVSMLSRAAHTAVLIPSLGQPLASRHGMCMPTSWLLRLGVRMGFLHINSTYAFYAYNKERIHCA